MEDLAKPWHAEGVIHINMGATVKIWVNQIFLRWMINLAFTL